MFVPARRLNSMSPLLGVDGERDSGGEKAPRSARKV
jgi:hypothetical protein